MPTRTNIKFLSALKSICAQLELSASDSLRTEQMGVYAAHTMWHDPSPCRSVSADQLMPCHSGFRSHNGCIRLKVCLQTALLH